MGVTYLVYCSFDCISLMMVSDDGLRGHLSISFGGMSIEVLCPVLSWIVLLLLFLFSHM